MSDEFHIKSNGEWTFIGEDSRLRDHTRNQVTWRIWNPIAQEFQWQTMDHVYCRNCGVDGGYCSRTSPYISYFCDKCWETGQDPARWVPMLPHAEWCWRNGLPDPERELKVGESNKEGI